MRWRVEMYPLWSLDSKSSGFGDLCVLCGRKVEPTKNVPGLRQSRFPEEAKAVQTELKKKLRAAKDYKATKKK